MLRLKRGRELLDVFRVQGAPEALLSLLLLFVTISGLFQAFVCRLLLVTHDTIPVELLFF